MSPDDERHGSTRGHAAGCREACCREARNADERRRRKQREVLGIERRIDGTGTQRRIQALWALGWTSRDIANACGWGTPQAVTEVVGVRSAVFRGTAETVARAYEQLSMTPGPSAKNRRDAARKGWAPPLAWEGIDIDDPDTRPDLGAPDILSGNGGRSVATLLEDAEWLADGDAALSEVVERLDVRLDTFRDTCARAGRSDLYWRLARREPDGDMRWANRRVPKSQEEVA